MSEGVAGVLGAFWLGLAAASGELGGALIGLVAPLRHRVIAAVMAFGAGVLLSATSISTKIASEAHVLAGALLAAGGIVGGAALFSIANAALPAARDRRRCGECKPQLSEAEAPGSAASLALGTALDAVPKALVLGVALRVSGREAAMVVLALALSNVSAALSATAGMRLASRSRAYVLGLWSCVALGTALTTSLAFYLVSDLGPGMTAILKAFGAGALIAMAAETMVPEAFHNAPRYSGVLAALGLAIIMLLGEVTN